MDDQDFLIGRSSTSRELPAIEEKIPYERKEFRNPLIGTEEDPYRFQLNSKQLQSLSSFKNAIEDVLRQKQPSISVRKVINPTLLEEMCLDIASKKGLTNFVKSLLCDGANPNKINEAQKRAPIHFATESGYAETLKALLLHPRINPNLQAGGQTALHIAVEKYDLNCADLLLEEGASAGIPDSEGLTALDLAATKEQWDMVKLIVRKCQQCLKLDEHKENYEQTMREMIRQNLPTLSLPSVPEDTQEILFQDLEYYLNVNDKENFIKHFQFVRGEIFYRVSDNLLELAAKRDIHEAVKAIGERLHGDTFPWNNRLYVGVFTATDIAISRGYYDTLRELLNIGVLEPRIINNLIRDVCMKLEKQSEETEDDVANYLECLKVILENEEINIRVTYKATNTPLHYAAKVGCREAIILLLKHGHYIGCMNKFGEPPIARIPANTLSEHFDNCVQITENIIECDYRCLIPHQVVNVNDEVEATTSGEMKTFMYIARNKHLKHLLKHPLLSSYLYSKWYSIRYFLYANLIFYFIFCLLLNAYVLRMTYDTPKENGTQIANGSSHTISENNVKTVWHQDSLLWAFVAMLSLLIFREILQLIFCSWRYLTDLTNWLQIVLITLILIMLCNASISIGTMVILLSTWQLVILIGYHPRMSISIEMLQTVSFSFMRFLFPYLFLILAFALIFHKYFKEDTRFSNLACSFFQTIIMLTSEFNISDSWFLSDPVWSRMIFELFIFLIAIVLLNLLNGLAISDITEILSKAELIGHIYRAYLISYFEDMMSGAAFKFICSPFSFLAKRMFPHYIDEGKIQFESKSDSDTYYVHKQFGILKMDPNITRKMKQIVSNKNKMPNNKEIIITLKKLQKEMTMLEDTLNNVFR